MARTEPTEDGDRGVIVNTASVAAFDGQIGQPAYSASKGGVHAMTLPIARELARYGIRVLHDRPRHHGDAHARWACRRRRRTRSASRCRTRSGSAAPTSTRDSCMAIVDNGYLNGETIRLDGAIRMAPK